MQSGLALVLLCCITLCYAQTQITVSTDKGPVTGIQTATSRSWKGIPFAAPPVGPLRWKAPVPHAPWGPTPFMATTIGPMCAQICFGIPMFCNANQSEDCLHLNVWAPNVNVTGSGLSVMVFFAGGSFTQCDGGVPAYDGNVFVNYTNVVLVTSSYRLGALGWLVTDQLKGNYGLDDQRAVLNWVQTNIRNFGGNPNDVTVFGESAGAMSIAAHLTSPLSFGLFQKAIIESDPFAVRFRTQAEAKQLALDFADLLGCGTAYNTINHTCLNAQVSDALVAAEWGVSVPTVFTTSVVGDSSWAPTIDLLEMPMQPLNAFKLGLFQRVPTLLGVNAGEAVIFVEGEVLSPVSGAQYGQMMNQLFPTSGINGNVSAKVQTRYPVNPAANDTRDVMTTLLTEYAFICPTRRVAQAISSVGMPTYFYYYTHVLSFGIFIVDVPGCHSIACHATEVPLVFDSEVASGNNYTAAEVTLSRAMMRMWSNFAKTGNPNLPTPAPSYWPPFDSNTWRYMQLDSPTASKSKLLKSNCDFWDSVGYTY